MIKVLAITMIAFGVGFAAAGCRSKESAAQASGAKELALNLGDKVTMKLVQIPAGAFLMGSLKTEKSGKDDEVPHYVTISKPFYMGITHVTVDQFAAFVKDGGYRTDAENDGWAYGVEIKDGAAEVKKVNGCSWRDPNFDQKGDHPVVQVSWNDAQAFCDWLSKRSGTTVSLPTEAQWEYACRAGSTTTYPWSDSPDDGKGWANCADQSLMKKLWNAPTPSAFFNWDDGFAFTSPVGCYKANAFGLYDMIGNAWQWCQDRYGDYDAGAVTDPKGADVGSSRVLRGGSWADGPAICRSACRDASDRNGPHGVGCIGFRVVAASAD
jgi:formylglycine-generating enzyme required for sulfatase activity